jgi:lysophospholipid acyltransferase (LPLAT)-like uncharacterized protein
MEKALVVFGCTIVGGGAGYLVSPDGTAVTIGSAVGFLIGCMLVSGSGGDGGSAAIVDLIDDLTDGFATSHH